VATAVGGITEVVVDGETGFLVPIDQMNESPFEPRDPAKFARDLAARVNQLMADPALCERFGRAGRKRAEEKFGWPAIAHQTKTLYEKLLRKH
jgi:glycosyltransferase involved in cell wall biosynthesis